MVAELPASARRRISRIVELLDDDELEQLQVDLAEIARLRRKVEVENRNVQMS